MVKKAIPNYIEGFGKVKKYNSSLSSSLSKNISEKVNKQCGENKLVSSIEELLEKVNLKDNMTISFHHHLRNGDYVLNMVLEEISKKGIKNLTIAASSIFPCHEPLVKHMEDGTVKNIYANYISGKVGEAISKGKLKGMLTMQTHGGRARAIDSGDLHIDVAFVAAPTSDYSGNINGVYGKSACGTLGYAVSDCNHGDVVAVITDNIVNYPNMPIDIDETNIDYIVKVESIGNPNGIVSGTTKITKDPIGLKIAKYTMEFLKESGYIKNGFSFQTGAGGTSLAVAEELKHYLRESGIRGSFASGGITGYLVEMLEEGLFESLLDVQCFDLQAVESYKKNDKHQFMSASMYGSIHAKGAVVNKLDVVILGATEIDTNFNVNVTTSSNGVIMGGSGGHSDTAAGAKLSIVVSNLVRARLPIVKENVTTITTPGETIDVLVTERGIAINPLRTDLFSIFKDSKLPIFTIDELKTMAENITGKPNDLVLNSEIVGVVEYRDGTIIDVIKRI